MQAPTDPDDEGDQAVTENQPVTEAPKQTATRRTPREPR